MTVSQKVWFITGCSTGFGRALAQEVLAAGHKAVVTARNVEQVKDLVAGNDQALALPLDVTDATQVREAVVAAEQHFGGIDVLVNNAGIGRSPDLASLTEEGFDEVFAVNVRAPFFIVQQGLKRLRDGGRIINVSSGVTRIAMPEIIAYGATKGALDTFTLTLAKELGPRGITVNSVAPGVIDTDVNAGWLRGDPEAEARAASLAALGRVGQPDDVADIVAFLASDDARWVTGQVIDATGGSGL